MFQRALYEVVKREYAPAEDNAAPTDEVADPSLLGGGDD